MMDPLRQLIQSQRQKEIQPILDEVTKLRAQVATLRGAAQRVIDNWDDGDLADSVRELSLILEATKEDATQ